MIIRIIINKMKEVQNRQTEQRKVILEEIQKVKTHPTASEIHKMVLKKMPGIGLATVYRNLDFLEKKNLIIKLKTKKNESRYDGDISKHCHLICRECGHIVDVFDVKEFHIKSKQLEDCEFKIDWSNLEIHGTCKNCIKAKKS